MPRLSLWLIFTVVLLIGIAFLSPQQLPVVLYKAALVTLGAVLGYWIDRGIFPYARPHNYLGGSLGQWAMLRRAIIVLACVLGLTLGL